MPDKVDQFTCSVDAACEEYEGLITTLREIQATDKSSGPLAGGLLKKITKYEFLGTLYLLKHMLPNLTALSKVYQTGSLNFARITPSLAKCKAKLEEVAEKGTMFDALKKDLSGRLHLLGIEMSEPQKIRVQSFSKKYADSICKNINARFPESSCKVFEAFPIFNFELIPLSSTDAFKVYGNEEIFTLEKHFFPGTDIDQVMSRWKDFRYHLTEIKKKYASLHGDHNVLHVLHCPA